MSEFYYQFVHLISKFFISIIMSFPVNLMSRVEEYD